MRADRLMLERGLAPTRSAAQRLIERDAVRWLGPTGWAPVGKAGLELPESAELQITDDAELRFVSRGGLKLEGALRACGLNVSGRDCLDVGQSTGGFTDVLLQCGARRVVGLDVGHGQLHPRLHRDPRVSCHEGVNARDPAAWPAALDGSSFGFVTGDLSFISATRVLPAVAPRVAPGGDLLWLVKPQFELQPGQVGKGGIVRDPALYAVVEARLRDACAEAGLAVQRWLTSPVRGGDGNTEFFIWARAREAEDGPPRTPFREIPP